MVVDVAESDFQSAVLERSRSVAVVVDFWAQWCAPCRALGPALEAAAAAREGKVVLAKVDVDANPGLARAFRVQGIPAVKAFKDGRVVDEFTGALPPAAVEQFFDHLLPSEADALVASGDEAALRRALELEPRRADAALALARILHARGDDDAALELLADAAGSFAAAGLAARIRLERSGTPDVRAALTALDSGDRARALEELLAALPNADGAREDLRQLIVGILDELGVEDPLARSYRRRLASALY